MSVPPRNLSLIHILKSLHKFRHGLDTVLSWVCALLFAAMVVVGTYQIVTRYFLSLIHI